MSTMVEGHDGMNETSKDDNPFHYSVTQNAKGFFQIKFKAKVEVELTESEITNMVHRGLVGIKKGIEEAGFKVQGD